jgi:hypothetical protein
MTLDNQPKRWKRVAQLFSIYMELPDPQAEALINSLPQKEQDLFDSFLSYQT